MSRSRTTALLFFAFIAAFPFTSNAANPKHPWEWTIDERLAARFDPIAQQSRVQRALAAIESRSLANPHRKPIPLSQVRLTDSIHGNRNPELLLPSELLRSFIRAAYAYDDDVARGVRQNASEKAAAMGLPDDFLETLAQTSRDYTRLEQEIIWIRDTLSQGVTESRQRELRADLGKVELEACKARADTLATLRTTFNSFDRFLYSVVAPAVFYEFDTPQDPEKLRHQEAGCR